MDARRIIAAGAVAIAATAPQIAHAESFNVPPGRLGEVATALGVQARVTIILADQDVAARSSPGARGNLSLREALKRALHGTGAEAVFHDRATIRIIRRRTKAKPPEPTVIAMEVPPEIVVTASKQNMPLDSYPGSVKLVELEPGWFASNAAKGTAAITRLLPALGSTNLGPGRNKLFIRGIADSSFSGPTQATTGQYLGDVRLNYNAPDPDLNLYDIKRVEVLVGPQGALYGASSLGGIIRLVPSTPDSRETSATVSGNMGFTRHGGVSFDGAGMVNLPLIDGRLAARMVLFGGRAAGYIDAPARGMRDINGTTTYGQRLSLRADEIAGWTIDLGIVLQNITSDDGQYTLRGDPELIRNTPIAQPFYNNYRLGYITASRKVGGAELVSTTSIARHELESVFDATGFDGTPVPARFAESNDITLFSHETRLAGGSRRAPWIAGAGFLVNSNTLSLSLGPSNDNNRQGGVTNAQAEASVFGQISRALSPSLTGMIGGRVTAAHNTRKLINVPIEGLQESSRDAIRFSGTFALDWQPGGPLSAFFRYQQGYRPGGLGIALSDAGLESRKFAADDLHMGEIGVRLGDKARDRLSAQVALFVADWRDIQADLIGESGLPYTTNIGRGIIRGLDGEITWRPSPALTLSASAFLNDSNLTDPAPEIFIPDGQGSRKIARTLPNIARNGTRIAAMWHKEIAPDLILRTDGSLRYIGLSHLGFGPLLDVPQGDYLVADVGAQLDFGGFAVSLSLNNAGDVRGNTFSYGNPFSLAQREQITPLRPRTAKLGISARF